jgi:hypothetical protein
LERRERWNIITDNYVLAAIGEKSKSGLSGKKFENGEEFEN